MILRRAAWLVAAGSLFLAGAPVAAAAYVAIFVLGAGTALANTTGAAYFSTVAPVHRRGIAVSGFAASQLGGQAFGPAIAGLVASLGTWRTAEVVAGMVAISLIAGLSFARRARMTTAQERHATGGGGPTDVWVLTPVMRVVLFSVPFVMFLTIGSMIQTLAPIIGDEELGLSVATIGLAAGLGGLCRFAGAIVGGQVADRVSRKAALVPGLVVQAIGVALLAVGSSTWLWVTAIALLSLGSIGTSIAIAVLADVAPAGTLGQQLGRFRFAGDLGLIAGPVVTARLYDGFGRTASVAPVAILVTVCAVAVAITIPETRWGRR